ncbi:MAG: DUF4349 domain-containing protein [Chitinophagaceae bacterium]|nr:DUF4349 domain-containing protein [Chitinophagaceae bacterium]
MRLIYSIAVMTAICLIISCNQDVKKSEATDLKEVTLNNVDAMQAPEANSEFTRTKESDDFHAGAIAPPGIGEGTGEHKEQQKEEQQKQPQKKQPAPDVLAKSDWDKKIIKTASVNIEVKDYNAYYVSLRDKIRAMGGYVAQEDQTQSEYKLENTMLIKVPVDQFDQAVMALSTGVQKINERKIGSQDVTSEVVDVKSRIEAKKQVRQRYMELLGQARTMEDILTVQSEINDIQEEIESAAGRVEYLSHSSAMSTISLTYYQVLNAAAQQKDPEAQPSFGVKLINAFKSGLEIIGQFLIVMITIWPLLLGSLLVWMLYKRLRIHKTFENVESKM